ncbi:type VI secretion system Vgr family protein [Marinibactrum halimedae]|uniref:Type IV secretion protein Rhs n=1 Tax=Marinibactrum halimedae TaxID=1444977 RepID=A0AA37T8S3_9GAMM|nr:type VI secretion system tip protein TssI/VgrG [Marinibactrum halimedae]MCD9458399.1 type VI secretion system tip protein VgrG [Marinibactrum halimedae]GLS26096.1 type IV secretion protein Rhs [Marinibactrum halimedae]
MGELNQDRRLIHANTPFGKDAVIATHLEGSESISRLFEYTANLQSDNQGLKQSDIVGKAMTFTINYSGSKKPRYIHGYVNEFTGYDLDDSGLRNYRVRIVPGLWFLGLGSNNRVFHNKSAKDILQEVLGEYSKVLKFSLKLTGNYITREYCVQYEESDLAFAERIMGEEGISYYFKHSDGALEMVLIDNANDYFDSTTQDVLYTGGASYVKENSVHSWERRTAYHTGNVELKDYNEFTTTKDNKSNLATGSSLNDVSSFTRRHFGLFKFEQDQDNKHKLQESHNKALVQRMMESEEGAFDNAFGTSDCVEFAAGGRFPLDHGIETEKGTYLITELQLLAKDSNADSSLYQNSFKCVPKGVNPRPAPPASRLKIYYPQLATVKEVKATTSDSSKDPYAQVKVVFPWNTAQNSCWVRVAQSFAGGSWGANFVPRVGQEVVINYVNGDIDRPIVTGAVYNGTNEGPNYTATQSGWKTQYESSAFNELRFDDKGGEEEIYMEAGKDHNYVVHNDQSGKVENDQTIEVKNNRTLKVTDGNESITIGKGNQTTTVSKGNHTLKISKGKQTTDAMGAIKITSKASIELKVGGSSIKVTPTGVEIKAVTVKINGSAMAEVKGGGMLTLKGGITMIN